MSGYNRSDGKVYLLGGGSGDIELLTLKGARVLAYADVVLYDRLVNPLFLFLAKKQAEFIYCGKLPDAHTLSQSEIDTMLVELALAGKTVVRLKGGDPAIFGRVGEEMAVLEDSGITYEVIPGITAASAASIYAGIPLTHRELTSHVTLITGHRKVDETMDYGAFVGGSLACYMGVKNLSEIIDALIKAGQSPETPIAIITWGSYGRQQVITSTLATVDIKAITNPSMIIIGDVVKCRRELSWFESLPFFGRQLLLVSQYEIQWEELTAYTGKGADVWALQVGEAEDPRFSEVTRRYLREQHWPEIVFLDKEETTRALLVEELKSLGLQDSPLMVLAQEHHV